MNSLQLLPHAKKETAAKKTTAKKSDDTVKLTATEKEIIGLYRKADTDTKKKVKSILKGEESSVGELLQGLLGSAAKDLLKK